MLADAAQTGRWQQPYPNAGHGREEANWDLTEHTSVFALLANMRLSWVKGAKSATE